MRIALTIDCEQRGHPAQESNPVRLLDILGAAQVRATFFVQGRWATAYPWFARRIADEGHLIGNHSHWHMPLPLLTDDGILDTVRRAELLIQKRTGVDPRPWFRCPYGDGQEDERVLALLAELGYRDVPWDVDGEDWHEEDPRGLVASVVRGCLEAGDGARVLSHSWPDVTVAAMPHIIEELRGEGAEFVTVDQLP